MENGTQFPQDFNPKDILNENDLVLLADSEDLLDGIPKADKKFSLLALVNFLKGKLTTTDIPEGTNKYVTDTNLDATNTIMGIDAEILNLQNDKEDVSNKKTDFSTIDDIGYPTMKAVVDYIASLGFDINGLTETTTLSDSDFFPLYNGSSNEKIEASNFRAGLQYKQYVGVVASATIRASADTERTEPSSTDTKVKEIRFSDLYTKGGTVRITFDYKSTSGGGDIIVVVNDDGTLPVVGDTISNAGTTYTTYSSDETITAGQYITIWCSNTATVKNLKIRYDEIVYSKDPIINLD